jgi:hypothetical protein
MVWLPLSEPFRLHPVVPLPPLGLLTIFIFVLLLPHALSIFDVDLKSPTKRPRYFGGASSAI